MARYIVLLGPVYSLIITAGVVAGFARIGKPRLAVPLVLVAGAALTVSSVIQLSPYTRLAGSSDQTTRWTWRTDPNAGVASLGRALEAAHIDYVWSSFILSWDLDFETGGRMTSSDVRYTSYFYGETLAVKPGAAWLFAEPGNERAAGNQLDVLPSNLDPGCLPVRVFPNLCVEPGSFETYLTHQGIARRVVPVGPLVAIEPLRPLPMTLFNGLRNSVTTDQATPLAAPPAHRGDSFMTAAASVQPPPRPTFPPTT